MVSFSISEAGRWWKDADTSERGSAAWMEAATEPRGGSRAMNSRPSLTRALAIDTTTVPASSEASGLTVATALSHGVATTTRSQDAVISLDAPVMDREWSGHADTRPRAMPSARSWSRDPMTTSSPAAASRTASPRPAGPVPPRIPIRIAPPLHRRPIRPNRWLTIT